MSTQQTILLGLFAMAILAIVAAWRVLQGLARVVIILAVLLLAIIVAIVL